MRNKSELLTWLVYFLAKSGVAMFLLSLFYLALARIPERGKAFISGVFSDGGNPSFSRVATAVVLIACIWWDTYFLYKTRTLPDFGGQIAFVSLIYGLNVAGSTASNIFKPKTAEESKP